MAEVVATFAAISSFLQVIDFTARFAQHLKTILKGDNAHVTGETWTIAQEYKNAADAVLAAVWGAPYSSEREAVVHQQQQLDAQARKLIKKLEKLHIDTNSSSSRVQRIQEGTKKAWRALKDGKEINKARLHLQELNGLLGTSLMQLLISKHEDQVKMATALHMELETMKDEDKIRELDKGLKKMYNHIMQSLRFPDMHNRYDIIEESYSDTFRWTLKDEDLGLRSWLQSGSGIFWISGKAGSGKSTLMKYMSRCKTTNDLLRVWSGPQQDLITASFFFWYRGSPLQKSMQGLLQSILYQILKECPHLAAIAFPKLYEAIVPPLGESSWTFAELLRALQAIFDHKEQSKPLKKTCLFIDGLDEYSGRQLELVQLLQTLAKSPDVKLCVSSRPWNVFRKSFDYKVPSIRLQDLTYPDIKTYVDGSVRQCLAVSTGLLGPEYGEAPLASSPGDLNVGSSFDDQISRMIETIVRKAEGVFLWVILVVKSVLKGIEESDPIYMLESRVNEFPPDLGEFFEFIIERVDNVYKDQTSQALKLACLVTEDSDAMALTSWFDYWLVGQSKFGLQDAQFAYKMEPILKPGALDQMYSQTQTFLSASCKDLLWLPTSRHGSGTRKPIVKVEFLHRTVYEYLSDPAHGLRASVDKQVPAIFLDGGILHALNLARLKFTPMTADPDRREDLVGRSVRMSLTSAHSCLTEDYVRHFEEIMSFLCVFYTGSNGTLVTRGQTKLFSKAAAHALPTFVAFQKHAFALDYLFAFHRIRQITEFRDAVDIQALVSAILGLSRLRPFKLDNIHVPLVSAIVDVEGVLEQRYELLNNMTMWEAFLDKWATEARTADNKHAWSIADEFMQRGEQIPFSWAQSHIECFNRRYDDDRRSAETTSEGLSDEAATKR